MPKTSREARSPTSAVVCATTRRKFCSNETPALPSHAPMPVVSGARRPVPRSGGFPSGDDPRQHGDARDARLARADELVPRGDHQSPAAWRSSTRRRRCAGWNDGHEGAHLPALAEKAPDAKRLFSTRASRPGGGVKPSDTGYAPIVRERRSWAPTRKFSWFASQPGVRLAGLDAQSPRPRDARSERRPEPESRRHCSKRSPLHPGVRLGPTIGAQVTRSHFPGVMRHLPHRLGGRSPWA